MRAVFPSALRLPAPPCPAAPVAPVPTSFEPCWVQVEPLLVKIQVAPVLLLSVYPPMRAVFPSALKLTARPCPAAPVAPVPTSFEPCWVTGTPLAEIVKDWEEEIVLAFAFMTTTDPEVLPGMTNPTSEVDELDMMTPAVFPTLKVWAFEKSAPVKVRSVPIGPVLEDKVEVIAELAVLVLWVTVFEVAPPMMRLPQAGRTTSEQKEGKPKISILLFISIWVNLWSNDLIVEGRIQPSTLKLHKGKVGKFSNILVLRPHRAWRH